MNGSQKHSAEASVRIGYFAGSAFTFYYPENLEALKDAGADLVAIDPQVDSRLPDCQALYIGGGFPETHLDKLSGNRSLLNHVKQEADNGLPIWAECGGLMYLAKSVRSGYKKVPMSAVMDADVRMHTKPQGHGYVTVEVVESNPFLDKGMKLRGHEFHYSALEENTDIETIFRVERGVGVGGNKDGVYYKNVVASYFHLHANSCDEWAKGMVKAARSAVR